jgi:hypothetical protein
MSDWKLFYQDENGRDAHRSIPAERLLLSRRYIWRANAKYRRLKGRKASGWTMRDLSAST